MLYNTFTETVIRDLFDPTNGKLICPNAVYRRTITEEMIGYDGKLQNTATRILYESTLFVVTMAGWHVPVRVAMIATTEGLYNIWAVKQLPWQGAISLAADTHLFKMYKHGHKETPIQISTLLNPLTPGGYYAYAQRNGTTDIKLVCYDPETGITRHPSVANTNENCNSCIGGDEIKNELRQQLAPNDAKFASKLLLGAYNGDWFPETYHHHSFFITDHPTHPWNHCITARSLTPPVNLKFGLDDLIEPEPPFYKAPTETNINEPGPATKKPKKRKADPITLNDLSPNEI
jgi:hypothetical protein